MIRPSAWIVVGETKKTVDYGHVRNATEGGQYWVWWYCSNRADRIPGALQCAVFATEAEATAEFERRCTRLWGLQ